MKILVTGSNGFLGKNILAECKNQDISTLNFDKNATDEELIMYLEECDFIMHLAGINRPLTNEEFYNGNTNFTKKLLDLMKMQKRNIPILFSSSIHAEKDNDYGKSKKMAEDLIFEYAKETGNDVFVYRLANAFGKWSKPNYNSVVSTFCYNISHDLEIQVSTPNVVIPFVYIDDIIAEFLSCLRKKGTMNVKHVYPIYEISIGELANKIMKFKNSRLNLFIEDMKDDFTRKLYSTYLSYLSPDRFKYELEMNKDNRGSFTELIRTVDRGQISINITKPGFIKGNHWHHTKNEKFIVVGGKGIIRIRNILETEVYEVTVSGDKIEIVDIPVGYTHNIENIGDTDLITIMWCNEVYDVNNPDTFYEEV